MGKSCIIVPYRDRADHLSLFVPHMKAFLPDADIKIIEQSEGKGFNRGKLLNVGFLEYPDYDYYIFHDVDMLPVLADYSYPKRPTHLATEASQFNYRMPYKEYFGGVTLFTKEQFSFINGYTNLLYSWGLEDDRLRKDLYDKGIKIDRRRGRYESLPHPKQTHLTPEYRANEALLRKGRPEGDGLNGCIYKVLAREVKPDHEIITVEI